MLNSSQSQPNHGLPLSFISLHSFAINMLQICGMERVIQFRARLRSETRIGSVVNPFNVISPDFPEFFCSPAWEDDLLNQRRIYNNCELDWRIGAMISLSRLMRHFACFYICSINFAATTSDTLVTDKMEPYVMAN